MQSLRICLIERLTDEQVPPSGDVCFEFNLEFRSSWVNALQTICYTLYDLRTLNATNCDKLPAQNEEEINQKFTSIHSSWKCLPSIVRDDRAGDTTKTLFKQFRRIHFVHVTQLRQHKNQLSKLHRSWNWRPQQMCWRKRAAMRIYGFRFITFR